VKVNCLRKPRTSTTKRQETARPTNRLKAQAQGGKSDHGKGRGNGDPAEVWGNFEEKDRRKTSKKTQGGRVPQGHLGRGGRKNFRPVEDQSWQEKTTGRTHAKRGTV